MKITERCACGAEFEVDDGGRASSLLYDVSLESNPRWQVTEVEAQARRWRTEHRHDVPAEPS